MSEFLAPFRSVNELMPGYGYVGKRGAGFYCGVIKNRYYAVVWRCEHSHLWAKSDAWAENAGDTLGAATSCALRQLEAMKAAVAG